MPEMRINWTFPSSDDPSYDWFRTAFPWGQSPTVVLCNRCGVQLTTINMAVHDSWHERLGA